MEDITIKTNLKTALNPGLGPLENQLGVKKLEEGQKTFAETLTESLDKVNSLQKEADVAIEDLASGKTQNIHDAMIAVGKADLAFRLTMQVRNKIVEAYQEVLRTQV